MGAVSDALALHYLAVLPGKVAGGADSAGDQEDRRLRAVLAEDRERLFEVILIAVVERYRDGSHRQRPMFAHRAFDVAGEEESESILRQIPDLVLEPSRRHGQIAHERARVLTRSQIG